MFSVLKDDFIPLKAAEMHKWKLLRLNPVAEFGTIKKNY